MTVTQITNLETDLYSFLQEKTSLISPEFSTVVADVVAFTSTVVRHGFRNALAEVLPAGDALEDRSFLEVAEVVVDRHLRLISESEREIARKSLLEAYFHASGPQYVFEPPSKTLFVGSLRRWGIKDFAALLLSLQVFNSISIAIQDEVRAKMPDIRSFEIYMLGIEAICRDTVKAAIQRSGPGEPDLDWARRVVNHIEDQLLQVSAPAQ